MTDATTPIGAAFELQRQSIKQSQQFVRTGLKIQEAVAESFLRSGVAAQRSVQRQSTELARQAADAQREALESVHDSRQEVDARTTEAVRSTDETATNVRRQTEGGTVTARREAEATAPTAPLGSEAVAEPTPKRTRDDAAADEAPEDLAVDTTSAIEAATERASDPETQRLLDLEGVGRTYVEGLEAAGVETLADLARTQANTVAEAAGISQVRATDWIQAAQSQT